LQAGYVWGTAYLAVSSAALVGFLALLALAPGATQRVLSRVSRVDLRDPGHVGALVLLAGSLYYVFGFGVADGILAIESSLLHPSAAEPPLDAWSILFGVGLNLAILVLPIVLYVAFVGGHGPGGAFRALGLSSEGAGRQLAAGVLMAGGFILALIALSAALTRLPFDVPENDRALAIAKSLSAGGALAVAVGAALSEEVFFRGFLLPRVGVLAQAILFSLAHLSYVNALEVVVTFSLGLVLGLMRRRTGSLWGPLAAHFAFDFLELIIGIYAPTSS
jgi:membrane protease YdiL (CAAX protease family)